MPNLPGRDCPCGQDIQAKEARHWSFQSVVLYDPTMPKLPCPDNSGVPQEEVSALKLSGLNSSCPNSRDYPSRLQGDLPLRDLLYTISGNIYHNSLRVELTCNLPFNIPRNYSRLFAFGCDLCLLCSCL